MKQILFFFFFNIFIKRKMFQYVYILYNLIYLICKEIYMYYMILEQRN